MTARIIDLKQLKKGGAPAEKFVPEKNPPLPKIATQRTFLSQKPAPTPAANLSKKEIPQKEEFRLKPEAEISPERPKNKFFFALAEKGGKHELTTSEKPIEPKISSTEDTASMQSEETTEDPLSEGESGTVYAMSDETSLIAWRSLEYNLPENGRDQAILVGIVAAGFFIGSIVIQNYLLAAIVGLAYSILYIYSVRKPLMIDFAVTRRGIKIGHHMYEYDTLGSFWIFYDPPEQKELSLQSKKMLMPYIKIPIENVNPTALRNALLKYIPEKKQEESVFDVLGRRFGL